MSQYVYKPEIVFDDHDEAVRALTRRLGRPVRSEWICHTDPAHLAVINDELKRHDVPVTDLRLDPSAWRTYLTLADYAGRYPRYYPGNIAEKSLEHHVAMMLLDVQPGQVFIDLASEGSPLPDIVARLYGSETYAQDIMYAPGINGRYIGGDAASMPVPDGFAQAACLTCSLEHFEQDGDTRLLREMARVLSGGGRLIVVPLYLFSTAAVQTDPLISATTEVAFDHDAEVYAARGWGNRHGRFYSPASLVRRLIEPTHGQFRFEVFRLTNASDVDASVYARWVLRATRTP